MKRNGITTNPARASTTNNGMTITKAIGQVYNTPPRVMTENFASRAKTQTIPLTGVPVCAMETGIGRETRYAVDRKSVRKVTIGALLHTGKPMGTRMTEKGRAAATTHSIQLIPVAIAGNNAKGVRSSTIFLSRVNWITL